MKRILLGTFLLAIASSIALADADQYQLRSWALTALDTPHRLSNDAVWKLREAGPVGLEVLLKEYAKDLEAYRNGSPIADIEKWERLKYVVEKVGGQKDCHASGLYWFTDLDQAKAEASKMGKPILSLRMLGKLEEEFSCANSRFFRTTLYSNPEVSAFLQKNFILHWQSVRPVPKVTIDFGDGRKIERTVTGNSAHFILSSDGTPIDALPGLYGSKAFLKGLSNAVAVAIQYRDWEGDKAQLLQNYHGERWSELTAQRKRDLARIPRAEPTVHNAKFQGVVTNQPPVAKRAMGMAVSKAFLENNLIEAGAPIPNVDGTIEEVMNDPVWSKVAALYFEETKLDENSSRLIRSKNPNATAAARFAITKNAGEDPIVRVVRNLEHSIADDTVRNEYVLHREIHRWFMTKDRTANLDALSQRVYAELFLTPDSDPWLGLVPADRFSALPNNGLIQKTE